MSLSSCPWKDLPVLELRYGPPRRTHTAALLLLVVVRSSDVVGADLLLALRPLLTSLTSSIRSSIEGPTDSSANGRMVGSLADGWRKCAACLAIVSMASLSSPPPPDDVLVSPVVEEPSSNLRLLAALSIALELTPAPSSSSPAPAPAPAPAPPQFSSSSMS